MKVRSKPNALARGVTLGLVLWLIAADASTAFATQRPPERWLPPLEAGLALVEPFRAPPHAYGAGHRGIDLAAEPGASLRAPAGGVVSFVGSVVDRPVISVRVDAHTVYSIEPVSSALQRGDTIGIGSVIGTVGGGGHCEKRCVHLGVRVDDAYVNPMRYFVARPVLLPW